MLLVHLDDETINSIAVEECLNNIQSAQRVELSVGVSSKLEKCPFFGNPILYLGYFAKIYKTPFQGTKTESIRGLEQLMPSTELKN